MFHRFLLLSLVLVACLDAADPIAIATVTRVGSGDVPRFGKLELLVSFSHIDLTNPYETRTDATNRGVDLQATFTAPDGATWRIPGFYDGTAWRIRFSPSQTGAWTCSVRAVDSTGVTSASGGAFTCAGTAGHGWVRIDGRWLRHADGTAFCPVGHNMGWQWDVEQPALATLPVAGSAPRLMSFWLGCTFGDTPVGRRNIERVVSGTQWTYDQDTCASIDGVLARAESAGVYLLPSIWIHDQLRGPDNRSGWGESEWDRFAYSSLGISSSDFFKVANGADDTEAWARQKNLYRYLIARWGASPAIAGWVGMVELNGTDGFFLPVPNPNALAWTTAVDQWFVANDPYRSQRGSAPICFSLTDSGAGTLPLDPIGLLSMRALDSYDAKFDDVGITDVLADHALDLGGTKPVMITEFGGFLSVRPTDPPGTVAATQPLHIHNGVWSSVMAGAAMPALQWVDIDYTGPLNPLMETHLKHLARFLGPLEWLSDADQSIDVIGTGADTAEVDGLARYLTDRGMCWLRRYGNFLGGTLDGIVVDDLPVMNGSYAVWWYDTWSGTAWAERNVIVTNQMLSLTVPADVDPTRRDIAVSWQRYPTTPTGIIRSVPAGEESTFILGGGGTAARILTLPVNGQLFQTTDGVTPGAAITAVDTNVTDPSRRVIYRAPAILGADPFTFGAVDARLVSSATASITVTNPPAGSAIVPVQNVDTGSGCGAGTGLGLLVGLGLLGLRRRRR